MGLAVFFPSWTGRGPDLSRRLCFDESRRVHGRDPCRRRNPKRFPGCLCRPLRALPRDRAMLTVFLLSLAGLPPLAGFIGKYYVFAAALQGKFVTLTIIAAINSVIAAYYYFRIIRLMYLTPATGPPSPLRLKH